MNLQDLCYLINMIDSKKRGGELVSIISLFEHSANPILRNMAKRIMKVVIYKIKNLYYTM